VTSFDGARKIRKEYAHKYFFLQHFNTKTEFFNVKTSVADPDDFCPDPTFLIGLVRIRILAHKKNLVETFSKTNFWPKNNIQTLFMNKS
jgi:hypothetical protein